MNQTDGTTTVCQKSVKLYVRSVQHLFEKKVLDSSTPLALMAGLYTCIALENDFLGSMYVNIRPPTFARLKIRNLHQFFVVSHG